MTRFNVGDIVQIAPASELNQGCPHNPSKTDGEVIALRGEEFCYDVLWGNGKQNSYRERDLVAGGGKKAKPAPAQALPLTKRISLSRKILAEQFHNCGSNGIAIHLRSDMDPIVNSNVRSGPCHGFIRNAGDARSQAIITLIDRRSHVGDYGSNQRGLGEQPILAYYDWLFNRSPYAGIFMYKSARHCWERKTAVLRVDVPANMLQGALICIRNTWEHILRVRLFHTLAKAGVEENLAFLLSGFFQQDDKGEIRHTPVVSNHHVLGMGVTKQGARAFLSSTPLRERALYNEGGEYGGVKAAWEGDGLPLSDELLSRFNDFSTKGAKICLNPFRKAKASRRQETKAMDKTEFVKFISTLSFD